MGSDSYDGDRAELFEALGHPVRLNILQSLSWEPLGFSELKRKVELEVAIFSSVFNKVLNINLASLLLLIVALFMALAVVAHREGKGGQVPEMDPQDGTLEGDSSAGDENRVLSKAYRTRLSSAIACMINPSLALESIMGILSPPCHRAGPAPPSPNKYIILGSCESRPYFVWFANHPVLFKMINNGKNIM
jgi:hypothetical protein